MLEVKNLNAYYGKSHILLGLNISVKEGEIVSLLGRNGVGRSTVLKSLMGMIKIDGSIIFDKKQINGKDIHEIANYGIGYVSENRDIFPDLTVRENLEDTKVSPAPFLPTPSQFCKPMVTPNTSNKAPLGKCLCHNMFWTICKFHFLTPP